MIKRIGLSITVLAVSLIFLAGVGFAGNRTTNETAHEAQEQFMKNGQNILQELEVIPDKYKKPADQSGRLVRLDYDTWESFSYEQHSQKLTKTAWVYLPYDYDETQRHHIFYLSHGGWSNEETVLGTDRQPSELKYAVDHAIQDGRMTPMILVCPTYNNTGAKDSWDYGLALRLTDQFHNELMNDLVPAVESKYHTWADYDTSLDNLKASRDHRGFGGFSMGSVNTWHTFQYCLDYFRYFMPMSGNMGDGQWIDSVVRTSKWTDGDFFIWTATGTEDFAASGFSHQIHSMVNDYSRTFHLADNEVDGNVSYRLYKGGTHGPEASNQYTFNGLLWFWNTKRGTYRATKETVSMDAAYTKNTPISDVIKDADFGEFGRLLFPADTGFYSGDTLGDLKLTWYSNIQSDKTVEIVNHLKTQAKNGETIFYDIYTDAEKAADPDKEDTGLFFFQGNPGEKFAICNAGGGFAYVGAMHDSFPHALELSKKGYNAFALIYRPGAQTACEDLARAIAFIFSHADELQVDVKEYSLWGGSAGARMAAWLGSYGTENFGEKPYPRPAAVIMQYTGLSEVYGNEPPTYNCVGTSDGIASYRTMQARIDAIQKNGTDAKIEVFRGLSHGFGLGTGTAAEGWLDHAVAFWERQMDAP